MSSTKEVKQTSSKTYYNANREKILEKAREANNAMVVCECGEDVKAGSLKLHVKSRKHRLKMGEEVEDRKPYVRVKPSKNPPVECCGFIFNKYSLAKHVLTKRHIKKHTPQE